MIEGCILQNSLLLSNISKAKRDFHNLKVYLDTPLIFKLLGINGEVEKNAISEAIQLLQKTGVKLYIFDLTIKEVEDILSQYVESLGSFSGRANLRARPETEYLIIENYTCSRLEQVIAYIDTTLSNYNISRREIPELNTKMILDDDSLANDLSPKSKDIYTRRVRHDVSCVGGILTFRNGNESRYIELSSPILATSNINTLNTINNWYINQGKKCFSPVIHYRTLVTKAWIKQPNSLSKNIQKFELISLCSAALRPSRKQWRIFISHLKGLIDNGTLSSEDANSLLISRYTDIRVSEIEEETPDIIKLSETVKKIEKDIIKEYADRYDKRQTVQDLYCQRYQCLSKWASEFCSWLFFLTMIIFILFMLNFALSENKEFLGNLYNFIFMMMNFLNLTFGIYMNQIRLKIKSYVYDIIFNFLTPNYALVEP